MDTSHFHNPYEVLYRSQNLHVNEFSTKQDAEALSSQLNLLHKTFTIVANDLIRLVSYKFNQNVQLNNKSSKNITQAQKPTKNGISKQEQPYGIGQKKYSQKSDEKIKRIAAARKLSRSKKTRQRKVVQILLEESQNDSDEEIRIQNRPLTRSQSKKARTTVRYKCQKINYQDISIKPLIKVKMNKAQRHQISLPQVLVSQERGQQQMNFESLFNRTQLDFISKNENYSKSASRHRISNFAKKTLEIQQASKIQPQFQAFKNQLELIPQQISKKQPVCTYEVKLRENEQQHAISYTEKIQSNEQDILEFYLRRKRKEYMYEQINEK